jgi:hypothetical protein
MLVDGRENSKQKSEESKENCVYVGALNMMMMMMVVVVVVVMMMMKVSV